MRCGTDSANTRRSLVTRAGACHRALQQTHRATARHEILDALESVARMQTQRGCKRYQRATAKITPQWRCRISLPRSADTAWNRCAKRRGDLNAAAFSGDALGDACTWQLAPTRLHRGASAHDIGLHAATKNRAIAAIDCAVGGSETRVVQACDSCAIAAQMHASAAASRSCSPGCRHAGHRARHAPGPASPAALSAWSAASAWARWSAARFPPARGGPDGCRRPDPPAR